MYHAAGKQYKAADLKQKINLNQHPLARAIVSAARERGIGLLKPDTFESSTGIGVRGRVDDRRIALGNTVLIANCGVSASAGTLVDGGLGV